MPTVFLETTVQAPPDICFDLSRSIDLHQISTAQNGERAISGVTAGLIGLGKTVTWRARHFGVWQNLTSRITAFDRPHFFVDEMVQGAFAGFRHELHFEPLSDQVTLMRESFAYTSPLGFLGRLADWLFLQAYMTKLLSERNRVIKDFAESEKWREVLPVH